MRSLIEIFVIAVVFVFLYEKYVGELPTVELDIKTTKSERKNINQNVDFYHIEWTPPRPRPAKDIYKDELLTISVRVVYNISCRT
jgi:hypothetical protein